MLSRIEEHITVVRALLKDASGNPSMSLGVFAEHGLYNQVTGKLNRPLILEYLRKPHGVYDLLRLPGMGHGTFVLLMKMMLEEA